MYFLVLQISIKCRACSGAGDELQLALCGGGLQAARRAEARRYTESFQHSRWTQNFPECVAGGERKANGGRRAIEQKLKQQALFIAPVPDLVNADVPAVVVGQQRIADAALRKCRLLRSNHEKVFERAAAELHRVPRPDQRVAGGGWRVGELGRFHQLEHRRQVDLVMPAAEE